jgi:hypothetical protein
MIVTNRKDGGKSIYESLSHLEWGRLSKEEREKYCVLWTQIQKLNELRKENEELVEYINSYADIIREYEEKKR